MGQLVKPSAEGLREKRREIRAQFLAATEGSELETVRNRLLALINGDFQTEPALQFEAIKYYFELTMGRLPASDEAPPPTGGKAVPSALLQLNLGGGVEPPGMPEVVGPPGGD